MSQIKITEKSLIKYPYSMGEVIILPPKKRLFNFRDRKKQGTYLTELAFPHMVCWTFDDRDHYGFIYVAFSNKVITEKKLKKGKCELWAPPFYSVEGDGLVCVNIDHDDPNNIDDSVFDFFNSDGSLDLDIYISNTSLRTYQKWQQLTQKDDLSFITQVDWGRKLRATFHKKKIPSDFPTYYLSK